MTVADHLADVTTKLDAALAERKSLNEQSLKLNEALQASERLLTQLTAQQELLKTLSAEGLA